MEHYQHQVFFFLGKEENQAFVNYCDKAGIMPYIAGQQIVKEFLMDRETPTTNLVDDSITEERMSKLEGRIEAMVTALSCQTRKCEQLEQAIAAIEREIEWLDVRGAVEDLECSVETLEDNVNELLQRPVLQDD